MHSALYLGQVRHRRFAPRPHRFRYRLFMLYLDLAELDTVFRGRWLWSTRRAAPAWWRRADYLGDPRVPLDQAVRDRVQRETGVRPDGPIRMLTHPRYFGICFNPVTLYYCFDPTGTRVETLVAEVTNTPWNERHAYVLPQSANIGREKTLRFLFDKAFHVSPFMDMDIRYDWRLSAPAATLAAHITNFRDGARVFDATLSLTRTPITGASLARVLVTYPLMTASVVAGIYWQALRLLLKRTPFFAHPAIPDGHAGTAAGTGRGPHRGSI